MSQLGTFSNGYPIEWKGGTGVWQFVDVAFALGAVSNRWSALHTVAPHVRHESTPAGAHHQPYCLLPHQDLPPIDGGLTFAAAVYATAVSVMGLGNSTVNVLPFPSALSTLIVPW